MLPSRGGRRWFVAGDQVSLFSQSSVDPRFMSSSSSAPTLQNLAGKYLTVVLANDAYGLSVLPAWQLLAVSRRPLATPARHARS